MNQTKQWSEAVDHCKYLGGSLASVHSMNELKDIKSKGSKSEKGYIWIGANDIENEGNWKF